MSRKIIASAALICGAVSLAWAPPCNYLVFPNACLDDYLETCFFVEARDTVYACYTNGDGCCGCIYYQIEYYCPLFGTRYGQESLRVQYDYGVCAPRPQGGELCLAVIPPGEG